MVVKNNLAITSPHVQPSDEEIFKLLQQFDFMPDCVIHHLSPQGGAGQFSGDVPADGLLGRYQEYLWVRFRVRVDRRALSPELLRKNGDFRAYLFDQVQHGGQISRKDAVCLLSNYLQLFITDTETRHAWLRCAEQVVRSAWLRRDEFLGLINFACDVQAFRARNYEFSLTLQELQRASAALEH